MKFNPHACQLIGISHLVVNPRAALWAQPGLGKTSMALTAVDILRLVGDTKRVLVVVPKRVLDTEGWECELAKWDHLGDLAIQPITGAAAERRTRLTSAAPIHLINFELLPWLLNELVNCWPYDMVIIDESTKVKGHDSTWFKGNPSSKEYLPFGTELVLPSGRVVTVGVDAPYTVPGRTTVKRRIDASAPAGTALFQFAKTPGLLHVAAKTTRWVNLTGTPMPNGVQDLWSQTCLLDLGERLGKNISRFREEFMQPHPRVKHKWDPQPGALDRVIAKAQDLCLSIKAADWLDLPELIPNVIAVPLDAGLRRQYQHLEDEFFLRLDSKVIEAVNEAVLMNKLLQFTSGAMYTDKQGAWQDVHNHRLDALRDLADEVGGPMLIGYHWAFSPERIKRVLKDAVVFDGKRSTVDAFARGSIQHLLLHPQSAGHGVDGLQDGTDTLAFFDGTWSLENHDQLIERIGPTRQLQSGHPRPVFVHYLASPRTVDHLQLRRVIERKTTQEILLDAMKERKQ